MILKERLREYVNSRLQFALSSRTIDIPAKETPSTFGNGMVMHYVSHVPDAAAPVAFHHNHNKTGVDHPPRTPVQLAMSHGGAPTPEELNTAVQGNKRVNEVLGHNDSGRAVPFFSDKEGAEKVANLTGGMVKSVVMDANKVGHYMRSAGDYRAPGQSRGYIGVYNHPELGDYFRTADHRSLIDHAQTASLNTPGAGELHELVQEQPDNHLHRLALADHLEDQGKAGLAEKVRKTVPLQFRRKHAIIRFCKDRLRYSLGTSKTGRALNPADPVAMYVGTNKVPGSGQMKINGPAVSSMPGMVKVTHEAIGNFDYPANKLQHTDEIPGYDPGTPPPVAANPTPPPPTVQRPPRVVRPVEKGESLSARDLPPSGSHDFIDPHAQSMGHKMKFEHLAGGDTKADAIRQKFNKWAGKTISDADVMDMLCVPRAHAKTTDHNHPAYFGGIDIERTDYAPDPDFTVANQHDEDYNYMHNNKLKVDPKTGEPYLYFSHVIHKGGTDGSREVSMPHVLYNAAMAAHRNGIKTIRLHAALQDKYVGGLAWPKLGFDAKLSDIARDGYTKGQMLNAKRKIALMKKNPITFDVAHKNPEDYTVLDLLAHPAEFKKYYTKSNRYFGPETPHQYPGAFDMFKSSFDTDPNSRSMRILAARLRKIESTGGTP